MPIIIVPAAVEIASGKAADWSLPGIADGPAPRGVAENHSETRRRHNLASWNITQTIRVQGGGAEVTATGKPEHPAK